MFLDNTHLQVLGDGSVPSRHVLRAVFVPIGHLDPTQREMQQTKSLITARISFAFQSWQCTYYLHCNLQKGGDTYPGIRRLVQGQTSEIERSGPYGAVFILSGSVLPTKWNFL